MNILEAKLTNLQEENTVLRQEVASLRADIDKKDDRISALSEQVNRLDQNARATSVRIFGLDVSSTTTQADLRTAVFSNIINPILETAKENGDVPTTAHPHPHMLIDNVFVLPSKKNTPPPVILKLSSQYLRNLIFAHKKAALPKLLDLATNKQRTSSRSTRTYRRGTMPSSAPSRKTSVYDQCGPTADRYTSRYMIVSKCSRSDLSTTPLTHWSKRPPAPLGATDELLVLSEWSDFNRQSMRSLICIRLFNI